MRLFFRVLKNAEAAIVNNNMPVLVAATEYFMSEGRRQFDLEEDKSFPLNLSMVAEPLLEMAKVLASDEHYLKQAMRVASAVIEHFTVEPSKNTKNNEIRAGAIALHDELKERQGVASTIEDDYSMHAITLGGGLYNLRSDACSHFLKNVRGHQQQNTPG